MMPRHALLSPQSLKASSLKPGDDYIDYSPHVYHFHL